MAAKILVFENDKERIWVLVNSGEQTENMSLPMACTDMLSGQTYRATLSVEAKTALILKETGGCYVQKADSETDKK